MTPEEGEWFRGWVNRCRWQYAKSMPKTPHEYTMVKWEPYPPDFHRAVTLIAAHGEPERFFRRWFTYLRVDGYKFWFMDADPADVTLINRADAANDYSPKGR